MRHNGGVTPSESTPSTAELARHRLTQAAFEVVRDQGWANASARNIAAQAGVSQALVFYHFGTVDDLVAAASDAAVAQAIADQEADFATAATLSDLLRIGRELSRRDRLSGNTAFMAQVMSAGQHNETLAQAATRAMSAWEGQLADELRRVLDGGILADVLDAGELAPLISTTFIGLELREGVGPGAAEQALRTLERLGELASAVDELGSTQTKLLRRTIRRLRVR